MIKELVVANENGCVRTILSLILFNMFSEMIGCWYPLNVQVIVAMLSIAGTPLFENNSELDPRIAKLARMVAISI